MDAEIERLWRRIQQIEDQQCSDNDTLQTMTARTSETDQQLRKLETFVSQKLENLAHELDGQQNSLTEDDIQAIVKQHTSTAQTAVSQDLQVLNTNLEDYVQASDERAAALEKEVASLKQRLTDETDNVDAMHSTLADIRSNMSAQIRDMQDDVRMHFESQLRQVFVDMQSKLLSQSVDIKQDLESLIKTTQASFLQKITQLDRMIDMMQQELAKFTSFRKVVYGHRV